MFFQAVADGGASAGDTTASLSVMSDEEATQLRDTIAGKALAVDQRAVGEEALQGRGLTCKQAAMVLEAIKGALMQRSFAVSVLKGRVVNAGDTNPEEGLAVVLAVLPTTLRADVEAALAPPGYQASDDILSKGRSGRADSASSQGACSFASPADRGDAASGARIQNRFANAVCVERLRVHAREGRLPDDVRVDLGDLFLLLGLDKLPMVGAAAETPKATTSSRHLLLGKPAPAAQGSPAKESDVSDASTAAADEVVLKSTDENIVIEEDAAEPSGGCFSFCM
eukprot:TRINITY_DN81408_c0_g1_i1.p1 TRINITY_DN81408_c0_g1~~TRINITY_DN81408_c0_g1_i1.p1  ORF type:complete len:283 (+),score=61.66 TRINITY_DN81408_c0_g1_i1:90-938(+)